MPIGPPPAATTPHRALWLLALALAALAVLLRLGLGAEPRPLHTDEAVNASLLGNLLAGEAYRYDPADRHGPVLVLTAQPLVAALGIDTHASLQAWHLRLIPALASAGLLLLLPFLAPSLPAPSIAWSLLWLTLAAPFVYYGGYFIHESLLLLLSLALLLALRRHLTAPTVPHSLVVGLVLGAALATKATLLLTCAAAALATLAHALTRPDRGQTSSRSSRIVWGFRLPPHLTLRSLTLGLVVLLAAVATAAVLFSGFGQNPSGPFDALRALSFAAERTSGQGHEKPLFAYASWYLLPGERSLPWAGWTLALCFLWGARLAWRGRATHPLAWWLALFTTGLATLYTFIPYKTPWLALQFLFPAALVCGLAPAAALAALPARLRRPAAALTALAMGVALLAETRALVQRFPVDPSNPLAYSPSSPDLELLPARLTSAFAQCPSPIIHVYGDDYWPLPWYLRAWGGNVGYYPEPPTVSDPPPSAIFLTGTARALDPADLPPARGSRAWCADYLGLRAELPIILLLPAPPAPETLGPARHLHGAPASLCHCVADSLVVADVAAPQRAN